MNSEDSLSLLKYIEEEELSKNSIKSKASILKSLSWMLYLVALIVSFDLTPRILNHFSFFYSSWINIILFILLASGIYYFRKEFFPKKNIETVRSKFKEISNIIEENGFEKISNDLNHILKLSLLIYKSNKEFIYIIDKSLSEYLKIILKISDLIEKTEQNSSQKIKNMNINIHNLFKCKFSHHDKYINILNFIQIFENKNFRGIQIGELLRFGEGKNFEGIEILNGVILIGRNEYFDGLIIGLFRFGKKIIKSPKKEIILNEALTISNNSENQKNNKIFKAKELLKDNIELRDTAVMICEEISLIRSHCTEFLANQIKDNVNRTSNNLKEKIETEKRIYEEINKFI
ncbi:hypothetical protein [Fluviispira multicolorata]|uniref:Uncharacterized protein n=1 Tax=Fluviispira multicolorata TaxID=2654512 RepID=A0A833JCT8_9BACT|nr:hypothetical protein [Fluviispira multicolorata]KAB8030762.1 hypothetical protein GCL57_07250 [Fluviispira multicolorata]